MPYSSCTVTVPRARGQSGLSLMINGLGGADDARPVVGRIDAYVDLHFGIDWLWARPAAPTDLRAMMTAYQGTDLTAG